ncbi:sporulation histidine kinase inhibitor Sda [Viridibacillus sp. YIM B01967]|uniref:Sporulation histidine kinase inhibitor Sda n=1 Tax=Viridibacillus soli TaxID=2798301 RepID=A0ABS1H5W0_9BACL|nr:sporulation histidine kinase inhibitor Sda [Viridibacillus soli]MBK3494775.1 sporulation histidine kinase inhibitor Sda [Viridibacillus soli]
MSQLSDDLLIKAYVTATVIELCPDFIHLLENEIMRRSLYLV